jgi:hypothetical protein
VDDKTVVGELPKIDRINHCFSAPAVNDRGTLFNSAWLDKPTNGGGFHG